MKGWLLDTNVVSERLKKRPDAGALRAWDRTDPGQVFASVLTRFELKQGAELHAMRNEIWARIEADILPRCVWVEFDEASADAAAVVSARLGSEGRRLDSRDCLLAGVAVAHDLVMVTRNLRHFGRVPGLRIENWFSQA